MIVIHVLLGAGLYFLIRQTPVYRASAVRALEDRIYLWLFFGGLYIFLGWLLYH
jgi:hypothetical protein